VLDELLQHRSEVARPSDQEVVETLATQCPDPALCDGVRPRCPHGGADDADVGAGEDRVERGGELAVPVADQKSELLGVLAEFHEQSAGLLVDPRSGGVGGDPGNVYAAASVLDHHQYVEAAQEDSVDVGEVDGEDRLGLRAEELAPGRSGPLRSGVNARGLEDLPHRRGGHPVAEADQLALDASIAPTRVLPGHPQHQRPNVLRNGRTARLLSRVGPAVRDQLSMPAQQRSG
jgi:hypothetical protein